MKIFEKTPEKIVFAEEINDSLANAIRRSSLEIPILAIDELEIHKNDSVLYDEVLALRLGLIPFKTPKNMDLKEDCSCEGKGCSKCTIQIKLSSKGACVVYAKDFKGKAEVVYEDIPIVELADEQEIELVATLKLGKGKEHTKFSPGLVYYRNVADIKMLGECKKCEACIEACPLNLLKVDKNKISFINEEARYKCDLCEACVEACKEGGESVVEIVPTKEIMLFIESWGQIKAEDILKEASRAIKDNLKKFV